MPVQPEPIKESKPMGVFDLNWSGASAEASVEDDGDAFVQPTASAPEKAYNESVVSDFEDDVEDYESIKEEPEVITRYFMLAV